MEQPQVSIRWERRNWPTDTGANFHLRGPRLF